MWSFSNWKESSDCFLNDCFCALWRLATGNSYHNTSKPFAIVKSTVVSIIIYRNILSNFREPQVEQPKQLLHLKKPLNVKFLRLSVQFGLLEPISHIIVKNPAKTVICKYILLRKRFFSLTKFKYCIINHWFKRCKKGLELLTRKTMVSTNVEQQKWSCHKGNSGQIFVWHPINLWILLL